MILFDDVQESPLEESDIKVAADVKILGYIIYRIVAEELLRIPDGELPGHELMIFPGFRHANATQPAGPYH